MFFLRIVAFISVFCPLVVLGTPSQVESSSTTNNGITSGPEINLIQQQGRSPTYPELQYMSKAGQKEKAIELAKAALKKNPDNVDMRLFLGIAAFNDQRYADARSELVYILNKNPNNLDARYVLTNVELAQHKYGSVIQLADEGLKFSPNNPILLSRKRSAQAASQLPVPQMASISSTTQHRPELSFKKLQAMSKSGQKIKAVEIAKSAVKENPADYDVRLFLGITAFQDKNYAEAREQLEYILNRKPANLDARYVLTNVELAQHDYANVIQLADVGLKFSPNNSILLSRKQAAQAALNPSASSLISVAQSQASQTEVVARGLESIPLGTPPKGGKANQLGFSQTVDHISDLGQWWNYSTLNYLRQTPYGSIIGYLNHGSRSNNSAMQYEIEAYPKLSKYMYADLYYAFSNRGNPIFSRYRYLVEPYFNLPQGFEYSIGQRGSESQGGVHMYTYTSSIGKYYKAYWISFRVNYYTPLSSTSYSINIRRFFNDDPYRYVGIVVGTGRTPDIADNITNNIISNSTVSFGTYGQFLLVRNLYMNFSAGYTRDNFTPPGTTIRNEIILGGGLKWLF